MIQTIGIALRVAKLQRATFEASDFSPLAQFLHKSAQKRVLAFFESPTLDRAWGNKLKVL
jgi:hypothetical protein